MANAGAIRAGRAFVELFAEDSKLAAGLRRASARLKAWGAGLQTIGAKVAAVGGAVLAPLLASSTAFANIGDQIAKMARRTGISVESLSQLVYAASVSGTNIDALEVGIKFMQKSIAGAADALEGTSGKLDAVGLSAENLKNLRPEDQFKLIADRIAAMPNPAQRAAAAISIFGRSGTQLLPMLMAGSAGIDALMKRADALGLTMKTEDAMAAERFHDRMDELWRTIKMLTFTVGASLAPLLTDLATRAARVVKGAADWINANRGLVVSVLKIAAAVVAGGLAIMGLGFVIAKLGTVLGLAATGLNLIGSILAFLVTPVGAVIGIVAALGGTLLVVTGAGGKAMSWLSDRFGDLKADATTALGGIKDALVAGDIALAARILWASLNLEWTKGTSALSGVWTSGLNAMKNFFGESMAGWQIIGSYALQAFEIAWIETTSFLSQTWTRFVSGVQVAWAWCGKMLTKAWNEVKGVFDDTFDVDAANRAADAAYEAKSKQIDAEKKARLQAREEERAKERADSARDFDALRQGIAAEQDAKEKARDAEAKAKEKAAQEEIDKAKAELARLVGAAGAAAAAKKGPGGPESPDDLLKRLRDVQAGAGEWVNMGAAAGAKGETRGVFNMAALQGLQAGGQADVIHREVVPTLKQVRDNGVKAEQHLAMIRHNLQMPTFGS